MLKKKNIQEAQAELINKQREREDMEETHKIEKKLYYQKIKYLMLKQQDKNVEVQKQSEVTLKQIEDSNREKEKDYKYDVRSLSKIKKEREILHIDFINALNKEQIKAIHLLKTECELKENQMRRFYREKMREMRINASEKRNKKIDEINAKKFKEIKKITDEHASTFNSIKNYYSELNKKNLNHLKQLASYIKEETRKENNWIQKKSSQLSQIKQLEKPLQELTKKNEELKKKEKICQETFEKLKDLNVSYKSKYL